MWILLLYSFLRLPTMARFRRGRRHLSSSDVISATLSYNDKSQLSNHVSTSLAANMKRRGNSRYVVAGRNRQRLKVRLRTGGSRTITETEERRRKKRDSEIGAGKITFLTVNLGRKMIHTPENAIKVAAAQMDHIVYRFQGVEDVGAPTGLSYYPLDRNFNGSIPPDGRAVENMPCYCFNLSQICDNGNLTNGVTAAYRLLKRWNPEIYAWEPLNNQSPDGTAYSGDNTYIRENRNKLQTSSRPRDLLQWINIGMMCVGAKALNTNWEVKIVQFLKLNLGPDREVNLPPYNDDDKNVIDMRNEYWNGEVRPFISHPLLVSTVNNKGADYVRTLYKTTFMTKAGQSTDLDTSGKEHMLNIALRPNIIQDYAWASSARPPIPEYPGIENIGYPQSVEYIQSDVEPTKRLYLIVKAQNAYAGVDPEDENYPNVGCSFDIVIRKKHLCQI